MSKVTRPLAILCLKQARLFHRPGTNDAARTSLERCVTEWYKSCKICAKKVDDEEWRFPVSQAEVKKMKKEWNTRLVVVCFFSPYLTRQRYR